MSRKDKRKPFTKEEKDFIYEIMMDAESKGLVQSAVAVDVAEQLDSAPTTIVNYYRRMKRAKKDEALSHLTEKAVDTPIIDEPAFMGEKDLARKNAKNLFTLDEVDEDEIEAVEYVKEDVEVTHNIGKAVEEFKAEMRKEIMEELESEKPVTSEPAKLVVEVDFNEIVASQTRVLLEKIEELTNERNDWKTKAEKLAEENQKLKDKFLQHILSN